MKINTPIHRVSIVARARLRRERSVWALLLLTFMVATVTLGLLYREERIQHERTKRDLALVQPLRGKCIIAPPGSPHDIKCYPPTQLVP